MSRTWFNKNFSPLQEYATTVKSADVGLAWEVHFRAKRQFELTDLKVIFQFCLQALKELCPILSNAPFAPELTNLVVRLTTLAETVLTWYGFVLRRLKGFVRDC